MYKQCTIYERAASGPSSNVLPSKDAVDDQFQHIHDVLAGIRMGFLNLEAPELTIDMLNYIYHIMLFDQNCVTNLKPRC